jgi:hypothetical protein
MVVSEDRDVQVSYRKMERELHEPALARLQIAGSYRYRSSRGRISIDEHIDFQIYNLSLCVWVRIYIVWF